MVASFRLLSDLTLLNSSAGVISASVRSLWRLCEYVRRVEGFVMLLTHRLNLSFVE